MSRTKSSEGERASQAEIDAIAMMRSIWRCGDVRELRAFGVPDRKGADFKNPILSGYYDDPERMAAEAVRLSELGAEAVYYTPNPCHPDCLARAVNRTRRVKKGETTQDTQITRRAALLIDADPVRLTGISSTDGEHDASRRRIWQVTDALEVAGWPAPIVVDSGNGHHALYALDLANDDAALELVRGALAGLAAAHSDAVVGIDVSVCNASRIFKVPGTWARKGDHTEQRPHRLSRMVALPEGWGEQVVTAEQLAQLAPPAPAPVERAARAQQSTQRAAQADDPAEVRGWIEEALAAISPDLSYGDWISVGVALKDIFGAEGLGYFDRWSSGSSKYPGADQVAAKWEQLAASRHPGEEARTILGMAQGFDLGAWKRRQRAAARAQAPAPQAVQPMSSAAAYTVVSEGCADEPQGALEVLPREVEFGDGYLTWRFGAGLCERRTPQGQEAVKRDPFGSDIWPRYHYATEDGAEHGVLYQYRAVRGDLAWGKMGAACFVANAPGARAAQDAAQAGVRVYPGSDGLLALALGHWAAQRVGEHRVLVDRPGWHRHRDQWVYLQGQRVIGDAPWMADPTAPGLLYRDGQAGDLDAWRAGMGRLAMTPGLQIALATSLAGALLTRLGRQTFIVNLYGDSTAGKSTSLWLAAAVWGNPAQLVRSWDATLNAMEGLALAASDACLCLDELQRFVEAGHEEELSRAIHALAGATGRARMTREAKLRDVASWRMCVLSTSESAIRDLVGRRYRGGDSVRALDMPIRTGELTSTAAHAEQVEAWARRCYGHAGEAFVREMATMSDGQIAQAWATWQAWLRQCFAGASAEAGRVLDNIAVLGAALEIAGTAKIHDWDRQVIADALWWMAQPIMSLRQGLDNPRQRQLTALMESLASTPANWPTERAMRSAHEVWGVLRPLPGKLKPGQQAAKQGEEADGEAQFDFDEYELWTQEGLLRRGPLKGHDVRNFLAWIAAESLGESVGNTRVRGVQGKWWKLNLEALGARLDAPQEATLPNTDQGS